jgi:hypothetical protein
MQPQQLPGPLAAAPRGPAQAGAAAAAAATDAVSRIGQGLVSMLQVPEIVQLSALRSICLHGNNIERMEGLGHLQQLRELNLSSNCIAALAGLQGLSQLTSLNLASNRLQAVQGLDGLSALTHLNLSYNHLTSLDGLAALHGPDSRLRILNVRHNAVASLQSFSALAGCMGLRDLSVAGNPACQAPSYRQLLLNVLPHITQLDSLSSRDAMAEPFDGQAVQLAALQRLVSLDAAVQQYAAAGLQQLQQQLTPQGGAGPGPGSLLEQGGPPGQQQLQQQQRQQQAAGSRAGQGANAAGARPTPHVDAVLSGFHRRGSASPPPAPYLGQQGDPGQAGAGPSGQGQPANWGGGRGAHSPPDQGRTKAQGWPEAAYDDTGRGGAWAQRQDQGRAGQRGGASPDLLYHHHAQWQLVPVPPQQQQQQAPPPPPQQQRWGPRTSEASAQTQDQWVAPHVVLKLQKEARQLQEQLMRLTGARGALSLGWNAMPTLGGGSLRWVQGGWRGKRWRVRVAGAGGGLQNWAGSTGGARHHAPHTPHTHAAHVWHHPHHRPRHHTASQLPPHPLQCCQQRGAAPPPTHTCSRIVCVVPQRSWSAGTRWTRRRVRRCRRRCRLRRSRRTSAWRRGTRRRRMPCPRRCESPTRGRGVGWGWGAGGRATCPWRCERLTSTALTRAGWDKGVGCWGLCTRRAAGGGLHPLSGPSITPHTHFHRRTTLVLTARHPRPPRGRRLRGRRQELDNTRRQAQQAQDAAAAASKQEGAARAQCSALERDLARCGGRGAGAPLRQGGATTPCTTGGPLGIYPLLNFTEFHRGVGICG